MGGLRILVELASFFSGVPVAKRREKTLGCVLHCFDEASHLLG